MTDLSKAISATLPMQPSSQSLGVFQVNGFNDAITVANFLANSSLVPNDYRRWLVRKNQYGKPILNKDGVTQYDENPNATSNCLIALNMANRMGYDPLMIMQNLYLIEGRPAWSSQFIIAAINACGKFAPLNFEMQNHGLVDAEYTVTSWEDGKKQVTPIKVQIENLSCVAWTTDKKGNRLESSKVDMLLAVKEGWYGKNGSKWQTMPEQMLRYRAAAFFGRIYAPEILMGISTADEIPDFIDVTPEAVQSDAPTQDQAIPCYDIKPLLQEIEAITTLEQVRPLGEHIKELSENPNVNLCGDDLPTLRTALTAKRDELKASLEQAQQAEETTDATTAEEAEEVVEPKPKQELSDSAKLVSEFMKAVNDATLDQNEELAAALFAMKPIIGEPKFNQLEGILDSKINELYEQQEAKDIKINE